MQWFSSPWFQRKPVAHLIDEMNSGERLHRRLGPGALMSLGVGATIGTGLYVSTGIVAHEIAGPSLMLSFLLAAIGCGFAALCYSELASMVPVAGSAYTYAYATLGELVAWIIGWDLILEYAIGSCYVANGWSSYFDSLLQHVFHVQLDPRLLFASLGLRRREGRLRPPDRDPARRLAGHGLVQPAGRGHHRGHHRRAGHRHQGKRGVQRGDGAGQHRRGSDGRRRGGRLCRPGELAAVPAQGHGYRGVALGAARIFFAYIGFDSISTHAEEARNPSATWPSASWGRCCLHVLYVAVAAVLTG